MRPENWRTMKGLAECPDCGDDLAASLSHAHKWARCGCGCRFMLPGAEVLFNNAAVYLVLNEIEPSDRLRLEQTCIAG